MHDNKTDNTRLMQEGSIIAVTERMLLHNYIVVRISPAQTPGVTSDTGRAADIPRNAVQTLHRCTLCKLCSPACGQSCLTLEAETSHINGITARAAALGCCQTRARHGLVPAVHLCLQTRPSAARELLGVVAACSRSCLIAQGSHKHDLPCDRSCTVGRLECT